MLLEGSQASSALEQRGGGGLKATPLAFCFVITFCEFHKSALKLVKPDRLRITWGDPDADGEREA